MFPLSLGRRTQSMTRPDSYGSLYTGEAAVSLGKAEEGLRALILSGGMAKARAVSVLNALEDNKPWYSVHGYIETMAALSAAFPAKMKRKTYMQGRSIAHVLWCATSADRLAWLFNGLKIRHSLSPSVLALFGSGTSPNEARR